MYFYLVVSLIAIILFVFVVLFLYFTISKDKYNVYPPVVNTCPDFWTMDASGRCIVPNITLENGNVGSFTKEKASLSPVTYGFFDASGSSSFQSDAIDFRDSRWISLGGSSLCNQKKWANQYNIFWDGVSNYNGKC